MLLRRSVAAGRRSARATARRDAAARALRQIEPAATIEATARRITDTLLALPHVDVALIFGFADEASVDVLAMSGPGDYPLRAGDALPHARAAHLHAMALNGPWAERWAPSIADGSYGAELTRAGLRAVAFAPIGPRTDPVGLLVVGTTNDTFADLADDLPAMADSATHVGLLVGGDLARRRRRATARATIERILTDGLFRPVFQPVVTLDSGRAVGYEALTRFDNGQRPDLVFADARRAGLGCELEAVTMRAAVNAAGSLPTGTWLSLNATAEFITTDDRLPDILAPRTRPIVIEVTEHETVADYRVLGDAIAALGPDVRVAADDAGVGVANFAHLVQLRPDFVKLDASIIRDVDRDLTRQALIAGLRHFTRATDTWLIAEGIETVDEHRALSALGVELGQGYLFGRPAPAPTLEPLIIESRRRLVW